MLAGIAALAILIPLTIPLLSLTLGQQDTAALSTSTTARQAYDLISENFGPGVNGPLLIAVRLGSPAQPASGSSSQSQSQSGSAPGQSSGSLQSSRRVLSSSRRARARTAIPARPTRGWRPSRRTSPARPALRRSPRSRSIKAGTTAYFNAIPTNGPAENADDDAGQHAARQRDPEGGEGHEHEADVGGTPPATTTSRRRISCKLPLQILVVIALSFVLLILAFRTVVIPPQAAVMNLLSIGASYGVLTAIFQYGWLSGVIGLPRPSADRLLRAAVHVRDPVRALDGLRGVPRQPDRGARARRSRTTAARSCPAW